MPPIINKEKCIACSRCVDVCPLDVFWGSEKKQIPEISYPEECWHCSACVQECPEEGAIRIRIPMPAMLLYK
jgi:adenylylsulfate reductase subunit B